MKTNSFLIVIFFLLFSCKNERTTQIESPSLNRFEKDWTLFQKAVVEKTEFDWNAFVEIDGQLGDDYKYLFETLEAVEKIKQTKYNQLYDATLFDEPVKQITIGTFDEFTRPEGYAFYFKETDRGLKLIGFEAL